MEEWAVSTGRSSAERAERSRARWTGLLLVLGVAQFVVEMAVEQTYIPGYDPVTMAISDLGGYGAGAAMGVFDLSVFLVGEAALLSALLLRGFLPVRRSVRWGTWLLLFAGLGAMGVGLFPEYDGAIHGVVAAIAFVGGGLGLLALGRGFSKVHESPALALFTSLCGVVGLGSFALFTTVLGIQRHGGYGGLAERMIVAPVLLWAFVYGLRLLKGSAVLRSSPAARPLV